MGGGCVVPKMIVAEHLTICATVIGKDTKVAVKPYNPYDLPITEMGRGQEHVVKAGDVVQTIGYPARKI